MTRTLVVMLADRRAGEVAMDRRGALSFRYDDAYPDLPEAVPLSLSMPLSASRYGRRVIEPFLWGLLPDNDAILKNWARRFHVSAGNPFALLAHVGEDCAGAVQLAEPGEAGQPSLFSKGGIEWLDDHEVAARLRALSIDPSSWRALEDVGQFSLAGAQPKTALLLQDGRWGVPYGRIPTTHILKPPIADFDGHAENEHLCLGLARALGLPAALSEVRRFEDQVAIVVERYDRRRVDDTVRRIHQEDMCQALAIRPTRKYEEDGGPGIRAIVSLLRTYSTRSDEDVDALVDAKALDWLIAGTDGHAKNLSVLHGDARALRLAPLYDLASALPYSKLDQRKLKLAMRVGGRYRLREIGAREWRKEADSLRLDPAETIARIHHLAERIPDLVQSVRSSMHQDGLMHPIVNRLAEAIISRTAECARALG